MSHSKLESASLLILGMESLQQGGLMSISQEAIKDAGTTEAAADRQRSGLALTNAALYPIVVELVLKYIWEKEHGKTAYHSHDACRIFSALNPNTQHGIETLYDKCCARYRAAIELGKKQKGPGKVEVEMAGIEEALKWNQDAVRNFKYELRPRGRSVPIGVFWNKATIWVVPHGFPNFAIDLTRWAARRNL